MKEKKSVLVTGGAGYIGSVLVRKLIAQNFNVKIIDSLIYGNDGIKDILSHESLKLIEGDIRNNSLLEDELKNIDYVVHLASIVGEPLCKKIPESAKQINEFATKSLVDLSKKHHIQRFIYSSTCSNYGSTFDLVDEKNTLQSLSLYSETKVNSEKIILEAKDSEFHPCVLRFATAFGLSPRMRFDLLLQEFIRDAVVDKKMIIFGSTYWRPLVHVDDISNAIILSLNSPLEHISGEIFNVGETQQNYTKIELAKIVQSFLPLSKIEIQDSKIDPRNYKVSFDKIKNKLGFKITKTVHDGTAEIVEKINNNLLNPRDSEFSNISKQTENVKIY